MVDLVTSEMLSQWIGVRYFVHSLRWLLAMMDCLTHCTGPLLPVTTVCQPNSQSCPFIVGDSFSLFKYPIRRSIGRAIGRAIWNPVCSAGNHATDFLCNLPAVLFTWLIIRSGMFRSLNRVISPVVLLTRWIQTLSCEFAHILQTNWANLLPTNCFPFSYATWSP